MAKKKISENPKAVESRERKANSKKESQQQEKSKAEDQFWEEAGEGAKSKAGKKKDDQAKEREAAAAKKAEAKKLAAEEDAAMASMSKKAPKKQSSETKVHIQICSGTRQLSRCCHTIVSCASFELVQLCCDKASLCFIVHCYAGHIAPAAATARG